MTFLLDAHEECGKMDSVYCLALLYVITLIMFLAVEEKRRSLRYEITLLFPNIEKKPIRELNLILLLYEISLTLKSTHLREKCNV